MKNYTVIVVGPKNSGKTVFLASMYNRLKVPTGQFKFSLEADDNVSSGREMSARQELVERYSRLANPQKEWEPGTVDMERWEFDCKVQKPDSEFATYSACKFTYIDHAGGYLTEKQSPELEYELQNAHCLLGLLDGVKILYLMKGETEEQNKKGDELLNLDLENMISVMKEHKNPIHFVISKWDLLHNENISLEEVRDRLLAHPNFNHFVNNRLQEGSPVRLIPVSAVGMEFAKLNPEGRMVKVKGKSLKPFKVAAPLACILPDNIQQELQTIVKQKKLIEDDQIDESYEVGFWDSLLNLVGKGVETFRQLIHDDLPSDLRFADSILKSVAQAARYGAELTREQHDKRIQELKNQREESLKKVEDEYSALDYAVTSFLEIQRKLDEDFPASMLTQEVVSSIARDDEDY